MDVFKITKKILADYIYDPEHVKNPPAHFHRTEKGWSDNKGLKSKGFYKENIGSLSPYAMSFVEPFLDEQDDDELNNSLSKNYSNVKNLPELFFNISNDKNSRNIMNKKTNDKIKRNKSWLKFDNLIKDYKNYCNNNEFSGTMSRLIGISMGNGGKDWRMKKYGFKEPTNEMVKNARLYEKNEQELLLHTGIVDESGYINIYRNTINPPKNGIYEGGHIESWSLIPEIQESKNNVKVKNFLITATVPLSKVVASFVGRGSEWIHNKRYEVLIESSYITDVRIISQENITVEAQDFFNKVRSNNKSIKKIVENENKRNFVNSLKLENLKDIENPSTEDLMKLRKMSPEYRAMSQTELIILFKTLAKEGYFLENGNFGA